MQADDNALLAVGIFSSLSEEELSLLTNCMTVKSQEAGELLRFQQGFNVLLKGEVSVLRESMEIGQLLPGDGVGDWGLWGWMQSRVTLRTETDIVFGSFDDEKLAGAISKYPTSIIRVFRNFARSLNDHLEEMSHALLDTYRAPSQFAKSTIVVKTGDTEKRVHIGTLLGDLLPDEIDGKPVVSGLFNHKHTSLNRPLYTSGVAEGLTRDGLEGRMIYRSSVSLLALEAAYRIDPKIKLRIGPSIGFAYLFEIFDLAGHEIHELARQLNDEMKKLVKQDVIFRRDYCSMDEAKMRFTAQGWDDAVKLIESGKLSKFTQNKSIQKSIESYRLTQQQKDYLRTLKKQDAPKTKI